VKLRDEARNYTERVATKFYDYGRSHGPRSPTWLGPCSNQLSLVLIPFKSTHRSEYGRFYHLEAISSSSYASLEINIRAGAFTNASASPDGR
jgi:hypothetical protein